LCNERALSGPCVSLLGCLVDQHPLPKMHACCMTQYTTKATQTRGRQTKALFVSAYNPILDGNKPKSHPNVLIIFRFCRSLLPTESSEQRRTRFSPNRPRTRVPGNRAIPLRPFPQLPSLPTPFPCALPRRPSPCAASARAPACLTLALQCAAAQEPRRPSAAQEPRRPSSQVPAAARSG